MKKLTCLVASCLYSFFVLFGAVPVHAAADTCTWDGSTDGLWSDGSNWTGCDNGGVPETGDELVFPTGASTTTITNDLAPGTIFTDVTFDIGTTYDVSGAIELSGTLNSFGSITYNGTIGYSASSGSSQLNVQVGTPTFNANIDFNLTGTASFTFFTAHSSLNLPTITGVANDVYFMGNPTAPIEVFETDSSASVFTSTNIHIWRSIVACNSNNCLGDDANPINIGGADAAGAGLELDAALLDLANPITVDDTGVLVGPSLIDVVQTATLSGDVSIVDTTDVTIASGADLSITVTGSLDIGSGAILDIVGGGDYTDSNFSSTADISGSGTLSLASAGGYLFGSNTTYDGDIIIESGGSLTALPDALGTTVGDTTVNDGGLFRTATSGTINFSENFSLVGYGLAGNSFYNFSSFINEGDEVNLDGDITLTGSTAIRNGSTDPLNINGTVMGSADLAFNDAVGSGGFTMSPSVDNTYSGTTIVNDTYLALGGTGIAIPGNLYINSNPTEAALVTIDTPERIADTATVTLDQSTNPAELFLDADEETFATIGGTGVLDSGLSGNNYNIGFGDASSTFNGLIDGDGTITKIGTGTLTLDGVTYDSPGTTPSIAVYSGNLVMNSTLPDTPAIAGTGGTINGLGELGSTSIDAEGLLNVGESPGCMTVASLTLDPGGTFEEEIDGDTVCTQYDQTIVNGNADLNDASLDIQLSYTPEIGTVFTIIDADSITGTFDGYEDGDFITRNGVTMRINYTDDVTLTVIDPAIMDEELAETGSRNNILLASTLATILILSAVALPRLTRKEN